jgi:predicted RNase H-like nuclease (RuvC/YqgF family)
MELFWILYSGSFDDIDISGLYLVCLKKMMPGKTLFDDDSPDKGTPERPEDIFNDRKKETIPLERLKNLEEKIAAVVVRVKALKEEKNSLERKIQELEDLLNEKNQTIESLTAEKTSIKTQVEDLLTELETIEL